MTTTNARQRMDDAVAAAERKLQRLKALRAAMEDDDVVAELTALFAPHSNGAAMPASHRPVSKNMERIRTFFRERDNEWATVKEIQSGARVKVNSLRQLLYRSHVNDFDRDGQVGYGKQSRFRLKEAEPD